MLRWIVRSSMQRRLVVIALALLLMIFGVTQLSQAPIDVLPEFSRPYVEIQIEALGLSAQEVEAMITTPLEADMLNGTPLLDIKPFIPEVDNRENARIGWLEKRVIRMREAKADGRIS